MKTAMQWLVQQWIKKDGLNLLDIETAKKMEKQQYLDLIRFMRTNDKMGKTIDDLYNEFINQNK